MGSEIEVVEQRLKAFLGHLQTEFAIFERIVYKNKNQHRRSKYFQYLLKVRRDLRLLQSTNLEEILNAAFLVIHGNRPTQKLQLLESLKKRRSNGGKHNFLERLQGVACLLSQMIEPMLQAAMEISILLARSFFMGFSLTTLALLARLRVLVQQMLLDVVTVFNTASSISRKEQAIKLRQEGFEVFREYYPAKDHQPVFLECIWQTDKYVLVEKTDEVENKSSDSAVGETASSGALNLQYESIEVILGDNVAGEEDVDHIRADCPSKMDGGEMCQMTGSTARISDKNHVADDSSTEHPSDSLVFSTYSAEMKKEDTSSLSSPVQKGNDGKQVEDGSQNAGPLADDVLSGASGVFAGSSTQMELKGGSSRKKVAFIAVKRPAPSLRDESLVRVKRRKEESNGDKDDPFFNLLTGGNMTKLF